MKKTIQTSTKRTNARAETAPKSETVTSWGPAIRLRVQGKQHPNTVEYRTENGRHLITLDLGEGAFTALRVVAHAFEQPTPEEYVLKTICDDTASMLTQITDEEAKKFVHSAVVDAPRAMGHRQVVLKLPEKAYTILAGEALASGYDSPEHMILKHTSSFCAQSGGDRNEKAYAEMFGLTRNGEMMLT